MFVKSLDSLSGHQLRDSGKYTAAALKITDIGAKYLGYLDTSWR